MGQSEITALVEISAAEMALSRAGNIHEMLVLRDKASAFQVFADAQGFKEAAQKAKIFQLKAERKAGQWIKDNVDNPGKFRRLQDATTVEGLPDGVDKYESYRWQLQASVPEETFNSWLDECLAKDKEITAAGLQRVGRLLNKIETPDMPDGKYRILYADPPWKYGNTMPDYMGVQDDHYPLLTTDEICALPIGGMAEDNAVLFLWVTSPILEESFKVIRAWGFDYKASFVWDKVKHVMGHYNSVRHELLLVCVRGSCPLDVQKLFDSVYTEERTEHSRKPDYFRTVIDTIYPNGKRIELFARGQHDNWESWGNEIPQRAAP